MVSERGGTAGGPRRERDPANRRMKPLAILSVLYQDDDLLVVDAVAAQVGVVLGHVLVLERELHAEVHL